MVQLYFTDLRALRLPAIVDGVADELPAEVLSASGELGLVQGMPFILGEDGRYLHDVNRFFRACPTIGVRSLNSLRSYGRDIVVWLRFLAERRGGKSVWSADREDIASFHRARRLSSPPHRISAASWNRSIAALDKFYRWGVEEKLIAKAPFTYRQSWARNLEGRGIAVEANMARERAARNGNMRFISLERYLVFRDVGLRGRLPDGREDPSWRGRNGERNALFAELLITTGLRLQEASSLLGLELPSPDQLGSIRSVPYRLAAATAKGSKGREIRLPTRLLARLQDYMEVERANCLTRYQDRQGCSRIDDPLVVTEVNRHSIRLSSTNPSTPVAFEAIIPAERHRLVHFGTLEPLALWVTEGGLPMPMSAWEAIFRRASARCQSFGIDIYVTPHMLRHSFAVHMLTLLLREQIGWVLEEKAERMSPAYRRLVGDPLLKLQRLMGHSRLESTFIYLDHLDDSQALVDAAIEQWGLDLESVGNAA